MSVLDLNDRRCEDLTAGTFLFLNGYNVQRIVYELIKNYMMHNTPEECGVILAQRYDPDPIKSGIHLDVSYNWKASITDKVPAIYVQRGDVEVKSPTFGQSMGGDTQESEDERIVLNTMPVRVTCVAAAPVAVVENLAEYIKQPLISFKKEIKDDFRLRQFQLQKITSPAIAQESKTNFYIDLLIQTAFDESWILKKDDLKIKSIGTVIFESIATPVVSSAKACASC